jgi:CRISP-associated protein Cas1
LIIMEIYINHFGARLRARNGMFVVYKPDQTGANNHETLEISPHEVDVFVLLPQTSVSCDAVLLALETDTELLFADAYSRTKARIFPHKPNSITEIWMAQLAFAWQPEGLKYARQWIAEKLLSRIKLLKELTARRRPEKIAILNKACTELAEIHARVMLLKSQSAEEFIATISGLEGTAGRIYFQCLDAILPDEYTLGGRNFRPTETPFNAFLNYGYAILYQRVEHAMILAGLHPHIGWWHANRNQRKAFLFDMVEPYRAWVDELVIRLFTRKIAQNGHAAPTLTGDLWLTDEGRKLLTKQFRSRFISEKEQFEGKQYTLEHLLTLRTKRFAMDLLNNWKAKQTSTQLHLG